MTGFSFFKTHVSTLKAALAGTTLALAMLAAPSLSMAEPSHGIAMYGEPVMPPDYTHLPFASHNAPQGGKITYGVVGTFDSVNPFILPSIRTTARGQWDGQFGHLMFETLLFRSRDEPFTLYGLLAEKVEMAEDRSWIEFTLNPKARWHDGKPVRPEDVIFTYDLLTEKGRPPFSSRTKRIEKIEKTGERKVRFTFNEKSNREYPLIVAGFTPVLPEHAINRETFDRSTLTPLMGSGPYKVKTIRPGERITYQKDPNYWGKDLSVRKGFFNFDEVTIEYFQQQTALFEAFKKGIVDVYSEGDPVKWNRDYDFPAVTEGRVKKVEFISGAPSNMTGFIFNTRRAVFADKKVRQALSTAFDFEALNRNLFFDVYKRTSSFWQGSNLSSSGKPASAHEKTLLADFTGSVQDDIMDGSWKLPVTDASGTDRKFLRQAFKMLAEAGYKRQGSQLVGADGKPLAFEIMTRGSDEEKIALSFQVTLEKLGVEASVRTVDDAQYQERLNKFDYDMIIGTYSASLSPGIEQNFRWATLSHAMEGSFNYAGANDPAIDHLITAMVNSRKMEDFVDAVRALDRVLLSGHYVIPLYHLGKSWVAHWDRLAYPAKTALYGNQFPVWHKDKQ